MIMEEKYKELLGKVYDLEGLLLLVTGRNEIPQELSDRIETKIRDLYESITPSRPKECDSREETKEEVIKVVREEIREEIREVSRPEMREEPQEEVEEEPRQEVRKEAPEEIREEPQDEVEEEIQDIIPEEQREEPKEQEQEEAPKGIREVIRKKFKPEERVPDSVSLAEESPVDKPASSPKVPPLFTRRKPILPPETVAAVKEEFSLFYSLDEDEESRMESKAGRPGRRVNSAETTKPLVPEKQKRHNPVNTTETQPRKAGLKSPIGRKKEGRPKFSLNDRFLYTRELFNGDANAFNSAIDKISTFERYEDAEVYFMKELSLDPSKSETHKVFLKMIKSFLA